MPLVLDTIFLFSLPDMPLTLCGRFLKPYDALLQICLQDKTNSGFLWCHALQRVVCLSDKTNTSLGEIIFIVIHLCKWNPLRWPKIHSSHPPRILHACTHYKTARTQALLQVPTDRPFQSRTWTRARKAVLQRNRNWITVWLSTVRSGPPLSTSLLSLQAKLIYGLGHRRDVLALRTEHRPESRARAASEAAASAKTTPRAVPSVDWKVIAQTVSSHQS